ncbi:hypothetical protein [Chryseobacterium sp. Leaf201]|uniref:hypothetical protein n=1 Tax=Chryseobacterium sp. Leaf201 TaxID=1735672 RepID=UPI0006FF5749|nr:hypothetical protein [Chryseobacterium sp. Leaf201]KQM44734.1 hypothetical protein ASE55_02875 [Chryseobacterium sp. Leaf201]
MKRLFYFILLFVGVATVHSCKDLMDEDGNPLLDINTNTGLNGPRALYREITDSDTLATYYYNGLQLSRVVMDSADSAANIAWSGDKISRVDFRGFLDLDGNGEIDKDSISYTQQFTYGSTGRLEIISENRSFYKRTITPPATTPGPQILYKKSKALYNLKYSAATGKLDSIIMKNGPDAPGTSFTDYSKTKYEYSGDNVSKVTKLFGTMSGSVFGTVTERWSYDYGNYDAQISPFTLLPNAYKISRLLSVENKFHDMNNFWIMSPNSPKRVSATDLTTPIPNPLIRSTDYAYDPQTYMIRGYSINYIYKPL